MSSERETPARLIYRGFRQYREGWMATTAHGLPLFESRDWQGMNTATKNRLASYHRFLDNTVAAIQSIAGHGSYDWLTWKAQYLTLLRGSADPELAETFFNSVHRAVMKDAPVSDTEMFVRSRQPTWPIANGQPITRT